MKKNLTVGIVQQTCSNSIKDNINKSITGIRDCGKRGAKLVVLQELHTNIYFCQAENQAMFDLSETIPGKTTHILSALAQKLKIVIVSSIFEKRAAGIYHNTAVVIDSDGSIAGKYRKMHIPDDPAYYEKFYFTPGDLGFQPIDTSIGKLGVLVCWDQWFPEAARLMAMAGAELLIYPTAIGWDKNDSLKEQKRQLTAWRISQRAHAISNGIPVVSVNRVGFEKDFSAVTDGITFWGGSFICGSQGEYLCKASSKREENLVTKIDFQNIDKVRQIWPFFRDRRIDAYNDLTKRYLID